MHSADEMGAIFERIRAAVFTEATRPSPYDAVGHAENQAQFTKRLDDLCKSAHLRADMTTDELWWHVWTKIRYAGFKAAFVSGEIERLKPFFNDFRALTGPDWKFDPTGSEHGEAVREFLGKTGRFTGISYSRLAPKLHKMLSLAVTFQSFPSGAQPLAALFGEAYDAPGDDALWRAHDRLARLTGFTTALHVMMDIGFACVKPDIWLVRLMCRLGWIGDALPADALEPVINKAYGTPAVARAVITRARQVAQVMHAWHPEAPLREFDFVMVKYGQKPGECGITCSLHHDWLPVQRIMEWNP
jgi:hypothetical protein